VTAFAISVDRLINQVAHWEQARWWSHPRSGKVKTTGDLLYELVQRLADLDADAEGHPRRPVPRLNDLSLPDQLRVIADDLLSAEPGDNLLKLAADDVDAVRRAV
jgi:hypothetical protein